MNRFPLTVILAAVAGYALWASRALAKGTGGTLTVGQVQAHVAAVVGRWFSGRVDPLMVRAMVEIESARNPAAFRYEAHINDASVGLMQTLLSTARWLHSDMGYTAKGVPDLAALADPETSIYFGAAYIDWLRRAYPGRSEEWIVRAYNGGPGGATSSATVHHWNKYQAAKAAL